MFQQLLPTPMRVRVLRAVGNARAIRDALFEKRRPSVRVSNWERDRETVRHQTPRAWTDLRVVPEARPLVPEARPPVAAPARADQGAEAIVFFERTGVELRLEDGETVLEAALKAGLDLDYSCAVGGCATCMLQLLDGEVEYGWEICLSEEEEADGWVLPCVCVPKGRIIIDA